MLHCPCRVRWSWGGTGFTAIPTTAWHIPVRVHHGTSCKGTHTCAPVLACDRYCTRVSTRVYGLEYSWSSSTLVYTYVYYYCNTAIPRTRISWAPHSTLEYVYSTLACTILALIFSAISCICKHVALVKQVNFRNICLTIFKFESKLTMPCCR